MTVNRKPYQRLPNTADGHPRDTGANDELEYPLLSGAVLDKLEQKVLARKLAMGEELDDAWRKRILRALESGDNVVAMKAAESFLKARQQNSQEDQHLERLQLEAAKILMQAQLAQQRIPQKPHVEPMAPADVWQELEQSVDSGEDQ
jgi:hypothetical protein